MLLDALLESNIWNHLFIILNLILLLKSSLDQNLLEIKAKVNLEGYKENK
jgi:hypothetical protein